MIPDLSQDTAGLTRQQMTERVMDLKVKRRAVILAHNYQEGPIQDIADYVGDSLKLAQFATTVDHPIILFCGVHFMAETAAMICPDKKVIVPDLAAGCSLADMILPGQVRAWKKTHPNGVVVCYINTSAAVKAECDYCCTSANAVDVVRAISEDKEVLFVPDYYLGSYVKAQTGRAIELWKGYCPAHAVINPEHVEQLQDENPDAEFLMHPECGCLTKQMDMADKILSTDGMMNYVKQSPSKSFIIATENGILYRMRKENPGKQFIAASEEANCDHMQRNTLEKVLRSLITLDYPVTVDAETRRRGLVCIERMLEISGGKKAAAELARGAAIVSGWVDHPQEVRWGDPVLAAANDFS